MLCTYNFLGTIKAIARVILAVIIVVIIVPGTEACSGGSAPESGLSSRPRKLVGGTIDNRLF